MNSASYEKKVMINQSTTKTVGLNVEIITTNTGLRYPNKSDSCVNTETANKGIKASEQKLFRNNLYEGSTYWVYVSNNNCFVSKLLTSSQSRRSTTSLYSSTNMETIMFMNNEYLIEHNYNLDTQINEGIILQNSFDSINFNSVCYNLTRTIITIMNHQEGYFRLVFDDLGIEIYEDSPESALNAFCEEFDMLYKNYAECEDENLTQGAIILKQKILSYVKEVVVN